jgi:putative peptide zinc metalloprotease protein
MSSGQPRLRSDLRVSRQETAGRISFVVKDPATGRFFRLGEPGYFIAQQLDGATPLDVVRLRAEEKFGAPVAPKTVEQVVDTLRRLRLLEEIGAEVGHADGRGGRVRGDPLYVRLKAFDPDRLLGRLVGKVWFCFTPHFLVISATLVLVAFGITGVNRGEIWRDVPRLYRVDALLLAWLIALLVSAAHEFAHGLTCKRFGGEVHEMGFMLIYFQPALYCNVSEAWLFGEKSKRLWVTFAGAYFELFLWALATVTWRVTDPGTGLSLLALIVIVTSGIKIFINLNPLIKLDGYYLLSDALGIPNLRLKAFGYLRTAIGRLWRTGHSGTARPSLRERRIYLAYGLLAGVYSFWLLGYVALSFGSFLVERYRGAGFVLYAGLLVMMFRNPLKRALPAPPARFGAWQERMGSIKWPLKLLVPLALALAVLFLGRMELRVWGEFTVLPAHNADVRAEVEGTIAEVYHDEGERVQKGDLLARLSERDYRAELRKVEAEIAEKQAKLRMLKAGPRREEIQQARTALETAKSGRDHAHRWHQEAQRMHAARLSKAKTDLAKAEERLKYGQSDVQRVRKLFDEALIARRESDEAEERAATREKEMEAAQADVRVVLADDLREVRKEVVVAQREFEEAKGRLTVLLAGSRPEEIEAAEAEIVRLEAQRSHLEGQLALVSVVSPISGVITTPKLKEKVGQYMKKGDLIAEVFELKTVRAEIAMSEKEMDDVKMGQTVVLRARTYPEKTFSGTVTGIAPAAVKEETWGGKIVRVTTEIDNAGLLLKPEMTGNAKVFCGQRPIFDLLTRRIARYIRVEFWSWW